MSTRSYCTVVCDACGKEQTFVHSGERVPGASDVFTGVEIRQQVYHVCAKCERKLFALLSKAPKVTA